MSQKGTLCGCGHGLYETSSVGVAVNEYVVITLEGAYICSCIKCGNRFLVAQGDDKKLVRWNIPSQGAEDKIQTLRELQWDSQFDKPKNVVELPGVSKSKPVFSSNPLNE